MLFSCMRAELMKLKRSFIWVVFLILPLISTVSGICPSLRALRPEKCHDCRTLPCRRCAWSALCLAYR